MLTFRNALVCFVLALVPLVLHASDTFVLQHDSTAVNGEKYMNGPPQLHLFFCRSDGELCLSSSEMDFDPGFAVVSFNHGQRFEVRTQLVRNKNNSRGDFSSLRIGRATEMDTLVEVCLPLSPASSDCIRYWAEILFPVPQYYQICREETGVAFSFHVLYPRADLVPDFFWYQLGQDSQALWPGEVSTTENGQTTLGLSISESAYSAFRERTSTFLEVFFEGDGDPRGFFFGFHHLPSPDELAECSSGETGGGGGKG